MNARDRHWSQLPAAVGALKSWAGTGGGLWRPSSGGEMRTGLGWCLAGLWVGFFFFTTATATGAAAGGGVAGIPPLVVEVGVGDGLAVIGGSGFPMGAVGVGLVKGGGLGAGGGAVGGAGGVGFEGGDDGGGQLVLATKSLINAEPMGLPRPTWVL